jgi:hypothetical protein
MKRIKFYDIDWCIDDEESDNECDKADVDLPKEMTLELEFSDNESDECIEIIIAKDGADYLSEVEGFLVNGFCFEILN